jgi:hypothetical protein
MSEWLDEAARGYATGRLTRRDVARIAVAVGLASVLPWRSVRSARAADDTCPGTRIPWRPGCPSPVTKQGYVDSYNGCGPADGLLRYVLPDFPMGANFRTGCRNHDLCYGRCGSDKGACDNRFHSEMLTACQNKFRHGIVGGLGLAMCRTLAGDYWSAVVIGGQDAFASAQSLACDCCACSQGCPDCYWCDASSDPNGVCAPRCTADQTCCAGICRDPCANGRPRDQATCACPPSKVYCACNNKCYDSATACTAECHASLACFTGICEPAEVGQC